MRMQGFSPREFTGILISNGWHRSHGGTHVSFVKNGCNRIITLPFHGRELSRPLAKRLLKEANICI